MKADDYAEKKCSSDRHSEETQQRTNKCQEIKDRINSIRKDFGTRVLG
jgi:hypothetical protein